MKSKIKMSLILALSLPSIAYANYEVESLMDSYLIAKAEMSNPKLDEEVVKKFPYAIQVASYINEKDAVSHVNELKSKAETVKYYPAFVRGQVWFKVYVGDFESKEKAEDYRREFIKKVDEPFAVVVSLLEQKFGSRNPSSVVDKKHDKKSAEKKIANVAVKKAKPIEDHAANKRQANDKSSMYAIQIGAFPSEDEVKSYIQSRNKSGEDLYYRAAEVQGKTWYRLFMGKFKSKDEARVFQNEKKKNKGIGESFIRRVPASE